MSGRLFAYCIITYQQKQERDKITGQDQMEKVLDILILSLKYEVTTKYKGFLKAMKKTDDSVLQSIANKLGKCKATYISVV